MVRLKLKHAIARGDNLVNLLPKYEVGQNTMRYAGIGSRKAPIGMLSLANDLGEYLESNGYTLYSGNALGMDKAFEGKAQPFKKDSSGNVTEWSNFSNIISQVNKVIFTATDGVDDEVAEEIAKELHPSWEYLSHYARLLMARNCYQILGINLDKPVDFVLCWTPDGCEHYSTRTNKTGGTGQAIDLASRLGIPVINLANSNAIDRFNELL